STSGSAGAPPPDAGAVPRSWSAPRCSWPAPPAISSTDRSSTWTAVSWRRSERSASPAGVEEVQIDGGGHGAEAEAVGVQVVAGATDGGVGDHLGAEL